MTRKNDVPLSERVILSVEETATLFNIGVTRLREHAKQNCDAEYIIWVGSQARYKRKKFEEFIDKCNVF